MVNVKQLKICGPVFVKEKKMSARYDMVEAPLSVVEDWQDIPVPDLQKLHRYWLKKKGDRDMPHRADIHPDEIVELLSGIVLVDVEYNPVRFKFRLVGTDAVLALGRDLTGRYLDEFSSGFPIQKRFQWLADHGTPYYATSRLDWLDRNFQEYHVLGLPLGGEQGDVNMILCGIIPFFETT